MLLSACSPSLCDREEWAWLQSHVYTTTGSVQNLLGSEDECLTETGALTEFSRSLRAAVTHLLTKLNIPLYRVIPATATSKLFLIFILFQNSKDKVNLNFYTYISLCIFCFHRLTNMACTPVSCCSLETRSPCCCCCLQVRISAPATGLWWAPKSPASPCPCRSLSWVGGIPKKKRRL